MFYFILTLIFIITLLTAFLGGFLFGAFVYQKKSKTPDLPPISEKERRKAERIKREYDNFLNYTGDEQPDIEL